MTCHQVQHPKLPIMNMFTICSTVCNIIAIGVDVMYNATWR